MKFDLPELLRLRCNYSLGDVVVLTAAVRDLHLTYPGRFRTSVETTAPEVWENNPYVSSPMAGERVIDCNKVELDRPGKTGRHYLYAYLDLLNRRLGTNAEISALRGDIHLSENERRWHSDIWTLCGREIPFWLIATGGKMDIPLKWWDQDRYQKVVDAFRGRIQFVQVGTWGNHHPKLEGAIDLRGKTSVRDLIHLVYYAKGVVCGVTSLMHLAAAVPSECQQERAAVIIGGAREPASWEAYPAQVYISTEKEVPCRCCWKSHLEGKASNACVSPAGSMPSCLDLIAADEVIASIEQLEAAGQISFLRRTHRGASIRAIRQAEQENTFEKDNINELNARSAAEAFIQRIPAYPAERFRGRGVVICGGGLRYFPLVWICIRMLRHVGCTLPVEVWHHGVAEIDARMAEMLVPYNARAVNAETLMRRFPMRNPLGWELKSYALLHSAFEEILLLDADNVPIRNPEYLFESSEYRATGAVFWPDYGQLSPRRAIWRHCGIPYRAEPEFESGQMLVNKKECWRSVQLAFWYNDHSEFFYKFIYGDKDTFHMAWRKLGQAYAMPPFPIVSLQGTMCQHGFDGERIFQHRNTPKFTFFGENVRVHGFQFEEECLRYLAELRAKWDGKINKHPPTYEKNGWSFRHQTNDETIFSTVVFENEYLLPKRLFGTVIDIGAHIGSFSFACLQRSADALLAFEPEPENFRLARLNLKKFERVKLLNEPVLDRAYPVACGPFPELSGGQNTGGGQVRPNGKSPKLARPINAILKKCGRAALLKLDCEGSEWPILLNGTDWSRIDAVCGEYHLFQELVAQFGITKTLDPSLVFRTLAELFPHVAVEHPNPMGLGRFWAARTKNFFASDRGKISFCATKSA